MKKKRSKRVIKGKERKGKEKENRERKREVVRENKDYTRLTVSIPSELDKSLRRYIAMKYQSFEKGLLSWEVEQAINHWIKLHTNAQKQEEMTVPNPTPKAVKVFFQVKEYLLSKYFVELKPGMTVPATYLKEAIMATRGSDKRTVKKWLETFEKFKLIKWISPMVWEIAG